MGSMQYLIVSEDRLVVDSKGTSFTLTNPTVNDAIFKMKFTAPERANIRPSSGFVGAMDEIQVFIDANETNGKGRQSSSPNPLEPRSTEKLLICAARCPTEVDVKRPKSSKDVWKRVDKKDVFETKVTVKFPKKDSATTVAAATVAASTDTKDAKLTDHQELKRLIDPEEVYANRRVVSPDETPPDDEPVTTTVRKAKLVPDSGSSPISSLPGRTLMMNRFLNSPPSPIKPVSPGGGGGGLTSSSTSPATPLDDADEGGSLPAISSSSSDEEEDNKQAALILPPPPPPARKQPSLLAELMTSAASQFQRSAAPPPPKRESRAAVGEQQEPSTSDAAAAAIRRDLTKLKSEMLETDSSLLILKQDQVDLKQSLDEVKKGQLETMPADDSIKCLEDRLVALYHKSELTEKGLKKVGYKIEDMTDKLVNNSNDANCRTKESVDRIAVTLSKMETRINQLAGKMELQDETMRQTCATKAQVQELEGQICNHLEKIGSNLAKRHAQPSPATDVRKRTSANETPDNFLVLVTGIAAAAAMTVLGLAILNKK